MMTIKIPKLVWRATSFAITLSILSITASAKQVANPSWTPKSLERLIKLPVPHLKKSIDNDFIESQLGQALGEAENNIISKSRTLSDLQATINQTQKTNLQLELKHQLLNEKRIFIDLMIHRSNLKRQKINIKLQMFEEMIEKLAPGKENMSPVRTALIEKQTAARARLSNSLANVDMKIFESQSAPESKYATKYDENRRAMEKLMERISDHVANQTPLNDKGLPISKSDYVRQMISGSQAELALVNQENAILGYMARLVQLDALALSDRTMDLAVADTGALRETGPANALQYFLGK